ncbi:Alpha/beta hydrolase family protein [Poseidonocella pacifica]|uniref:Palmitoyl-protein thioesterase ABHD10, mitochondrial n=1 Tax=Poseidonocella pacifica TaxID=871651 RepID=A0A1I0X281_9RHOB|nr:alpha/beta hydrolase [Poseidonocella pacifica]SFA95112.1 Alpha/beta hydrolase family protein [Poseidonocella pacifica]
METPQGRRIAYRWTDGGGAPIVFFGGYKSDMEGTKATHIEAWAQAEGRAFLRFDYSGHGRSSGNFEEGTIGAWTQDALAALELCGERAPVLVGSSMGGWIALICSQMLGRVKGLVGIAAAPDFTEDSFWNSFDEQQREQIMGQGRLELPSGYDEPYVVTRALIEDGRHNLVLRDTLNLSFPVRLLHGTADSSVAQEVPLKLMEHALCDDLHLTFVKGADHGFSSPECLALIQSAITEVAGPI